MGDYQSSRALAYYLGEAGIPYSASDPDPFPVTLGPDYNLSTLIAPKLPPGTTVTDSWALKSGTGATVTSNGDLTATENGLSIHDAAEYLVFTAVVDNGSSGYEEIEAVLLLTYGDGFEILTSPDELYNTEVRTQTYSGGFHLAFDSDLSESDEAWQIGYGVVSYSPASGPADHSVTVADPELLTVGVTQPSANGCIYPYYHLGLRNEVGVTTLTIGFTGELFGTPHTGSFTRRVFTSPFQDGYAYWRFGNGGHDDDGERDRLGGRRTSTISQVVFVFIEYRFTPRSAGHRYHDPGWFAGASFYHASGHRSDNRRSRFRRRSGFVRRGRGYLGMPSLLRQRPYLHNHRQPRRGPTNRRCRRPLFRLPGSSHPPRRITIPRPRRPHRRLPPGSGWGRGVRRNGRGGAQRG